MKDGNRRTEEFLCFIFHKCIPFLSSSADSSPSSTLVFKLSTFVCVRALSPWPWHIRRKIQFQRRERQGQRRHTHRIDGEEACADCHLCLTPPSSYVRDVRCHFWYVRIYAWGTISGRHIIVTNSILFDISFCMHVVVHKFGILVRCAAGPVEADGRTKEENFLFLTNKFDELISMINAYNW